MHQGLTFDLSQQLRVLRQTESTPRPSKDYSKPAPVVARPQEPAVVDERCRVCQFTGLELRADSKRCLTCGVEQ